MEQLDIKTVQQRLLNIAIVVDELCAKHSIPFYMISGTMLGAVRHKGFISWDDDMDFAVPYQYYTVLISILNKELPDEFRCLTYDNSETYKIPWIKVENVETKVIDNSLYVKEDKMPGLTIDIFPLVRCNKDVGHHTVRKIQRWIKMLRFAYSKSSPNNCIKSIIKRSVKFIFPVSPKGINDRIMHLTDSILPGEYYVIPMDPNYSNRYFPIYWFEPLTRYEFEDKLLYGVAKYDNYLKEIYGNYMVLPPIEKRRVHCDIVFEVD